MQRMRISLRLMLLVVALFAFLFAWIGAKKHLQETNARGRIQELQLMREFAEKRMASHPEEASTWNLSVKQIDDELKQLE